MTLPSDVLAWLEAIHTEPDIALVRLFEQETGQRAPTRASRRRHARLVSLGKTHALIAAPTTLLRKLRGILAVELGPSDAVPMLPPLGTVADLELAIVDWLEQDVGSPKERRALTTLRRLLRDWRHDEGLRFPTRSLVVVEQAPAGSSPTSRRSSKRRR